MPLRAESPRAITLLFCLGFVGCGDVQPEAGPGLEATYAEADSLSEAGHDVEAGGLLLEVGRESGSANVAFKAAGYFASGGAVEDALAAIVVAGELGYAHPVYLTNPDFAPLRELADWHLAEARIEQNYKQSGINTELYEIYRADQDDRQYSGDPIETIGERDLPRIARVIEILGEGGADHAHDLLHAAMVLHHSYVPEENLLAAQLADSARTAERPHVVAAWLSGAARDRHLSRLGEPQWYGTQMVTIDGVMVLDPATIDTTAVTAEQRAERNAPSVAQLRELMALHDSIVGAR